MTHIKIISNPYINNIAFQRKTPDGAWQDIDYDSNPNSTLLNDDLRRGFFPFIAEKIVRAIIDEYQDENARVAIVFEGTADEYHELALICDDEPFKQQVALSRSEKSLANANDILPEIIAIFKSLEPIIAENDSDSVRKTLAKFTDVAKDVIPICVVGNYSSGKSTFINALIGAEIMPSGDEPVTAKIYSVSPSPQADCASVAFTCQGQDARILFTGESTAFFAPESALIMQIKSRLAADEHATLAQRVHTVLLTLNTYENDHETSDISALITVAIPFNGGLWADSAHQFIIFDTPGSNAAGHQDHQRVLSQAVADLSNGIPIFVSEFNALDSVDNANLIREIKTMDGMDARFAMIVVNKADAASLPKDGFTAEKTAELLGETIPKNLFGEGIFFVSSVVGLGAKTGGTFSDEHSSEIYEDQEEKYRDPDNKRYKQLYLYNIMPGKQKAHALAAAQTCDDLRFVNSGLFAVEHEIQNFADHYAAYNKCAQSRVFLKALIDMTSQNIDEVKADIEASKQQGEEKLANDKTALIAQIKEQGDEHEAGSKRAYVVHMASLLDEILQTYYQASLEDEQEKLLAKQREEKDFEDLKAIADRHVKAFGDNVAKQFDKDVVQSRMKTLGKRIAAGVKNIDKLEAPDVSKLKSAGENLYRDAQEKIGAAKDWIDTNNEINETVKEQLIAQLNDDYRRYCADAQDKINAESAVYYQNQAADIKAALVQIVTEAPLLSEERREELSEIITAYHGVDFGKQKNVFYKRDFEGLFDKKMNLEKLKNAYNDLMANDIRKIKMAIRDSHEASFHAWLVNLYAVIEENIVDYNPTLREQQQIIDRQTERIAQLAAKRDKLAASSDSIQKMMAWSE